MTKAYRTIEDRLEQIEMDVQEVKQLVKDIILKKKKEENERNDDLMDVKDDAFYLDVQVATVYAACIKGELNHIKLGKFYKFKKEDVLEWIEKNRNNQKVDVDDYVEKYLQKNILKG